MDEMVVVAMMDASVKVVEEYQLMGNMVIVAVVDAWVEVMVED